MNRLVQSPIKSLVRSLFESLTKSLIANLSVGLVKKLVMSTIGSLFQSLIKSILKSLIKSLMKTPLKSVIKSLIPLGSNLERSCSFIFVQSLIPISVVFLLLYFLGSEFIEKKLQLEAAGPHKCSDVCAHLCGT
jgi:hypothetical protein